MGRPKRRRVSPDQIAIDLVDRQLTRSAPNQLRVTDITEHPTREGKVYCAMVVDASSRRVVHRRLATAALVTNALGMTIDRRLGSYGTQPGLTAADPQGRMG